jgi:hypothetical protein
MVIMGNVWDRTIEFLSDNLSVVVPLALVGIFVPYSIMMAITPLAALGIAKGVVSFAVLLLALWILWGTLTIVSLTLDPDGGRAGASRTATRRFPAAVGLWLIVAIILIVLLLPMPLILAASGADLSSLAATGHLTIKPGTAGSGWALLYLFVYMVFALWVAARLILLNPVLVGEQRGLGALSRSFQLTRGLAWRAFGVILLYVIVSQVAELAARLVFGTVLALISDGDGPVTLASVLTSIIVAAIATVFAVLASTFTAKLYIAVRDWRATEAVATA